MKILAAVILAMGLFAGIHFYRTEAPSHDKCENVFVSGVYTSYCQQLGLPEFEDPKEQRQFHEQFVRDLRDGKRDLDGLFSKPALTQAYMEFLETYIPPYTSGDFCAYLEKGLDALRKQPRFTGLKSNTPYDDSLLEGNLPFLQFTLPDETKVIRMAMPVMDGPAYFQSRGVHPEFIHFVRSQRKHLYVNLMKRHGLEGPLTFALEGLEESEPNILVVTLDKNSDFYWQEKDFKGSAAEFKGEFLSQLMGKNYHWPESLQNDVWKKELSAILDEIHAQYFKKRASLGQKERQDFIELSYLSILDLLLEHFQPSSLNITCKQSMDRGPSLSVLWQLKHSKASPREAAALLFVPPLLVHNRPTHRSRLTRFISVYNLLYSKNN